MGGCYHDGLARVANRFLLILTASIPEPQRAAWLKHQAHGFRDQDGFEKELVRHVETTLARSMFNCDESAAYSATSLAFRDRLILEWNRTQQRQTYADSKRVYYLSLEFLMGRALDNAMLNIGSKDVAKGKSAKAYLPTFSRNTFDAGIFDILYVCVCVWRKGREGRGHRVSR